MVSQRGHAGNGSVDGDQETKGWKIDQSPVVGVVNLTPRMLDVLQDGEKGIGQLGDEEYIMDEDSMRVPHLYVQCDHPITPECGGWLGSSVTICQADPRDGRVRLEVYEEGPVVSHVRISGAIN